MSTIEEVHYRDSFAQSRADNPLSKPLKTDAGPFGHTYFLPSPAQSVLRAVTFRRERSIVMGDNSCHGPDSTTSVPRSAYEWFQTRFALVFAHQLSSLSVAQAVYYDSTGIGGTLVWVFAAFMFPLTAVLFLLMALIIKIRSRHGWTRTSSGHL
ncbi:hypothetical protein CIK59_18840 [Brevibacterium aurantiacum]|uniref:Uncharacterized protein n=1 Tax=Brevibacterium aurantiacum TaxID=273384 RepID=A0A2A3ZKX0_BREAU|nr:hypothetical protein CIK59_18840 [Brevibacterium aurantiacum]